MINKVILLGNVGADPNISSLPSNSRVANFSLATSETWKDESGQRKERTEWHRVVIYNDSLVNIVEKYVKKGSKIFIEASIRSRKYTDSSGVEKHITEIVLRGFNDRLKLLDSKSTSHDSSSGSNFNSGESESMGQSSDNSEDVDDEIPF